MTSLSQLLAEDLDVSLASVDIVCRRHGPVPVGHGHLRLAEHQVVRAGAARRRRRGARRLLALAAERLQVPVESLSVKAGVVTAAGDAAKKVTYGQLTEGSASSASSPSKPAVKPVKAFTIVGTSAPRRDAIEKVTGKAKYAGDIAPAGALHARILRPPAHGATLYGVDTSAAEKLPGVTVIRDGDLVAVLHQHWDEADRALALVKATFTRNDPPVDNATIFDHLVKNAPRSSASRQAAIRPRTRARAAGVRADVLRQLHGARRRWKTHSAVAAVGERQGHRVGGHADAVPGEEPDHAGAPAPGREGARHHAVRGRGLRRQVRVAPGGRGRAARHAGRQAGARGVQPRGGVLLRHVPPASVIKIRSGLDASGKIVTWEYQVSPPASAAPHTSTTSLTTGRSLTARGAARAFRGITPSPSGRGAPPARAPTRSRAKSHVDVMAAKAGIDPVEFRLKNLTDARHDPTLKAAARSSAGPRRRRRAGAGSGWPAASTPARTTR